MGETNGSIGRELVEHHELALGYFLEGVEVFIQLR
jgi:hypothetical protein